MFRQQNFTWKGKVEMQNIEGIIGKLIKFFYRTSQVIFILFVIVGLVIFIVARNRIDRQTRQLAYEIENFYYGYIDLEVAIDETIPIELEVPLGELVDMHRLFTPEIPFSAVVPINTTVRINEVLRVPVNLPVVGSIILDVPINTDVPVNQNIPVNTSIRLDPAAFIDPDSLVFINEEIRVNVPINIEISPADFILISQMESLADMINTLRLLFILGSLDVNWKPLNE